MQHAVEKCFPLSPLQPLVLSFLEARKRMLSQGEQETSRVKVWKAGVGLERTRAASAGVKGIGVGERKGVQKAVWLLKLRGTGWLGVAKVWSKPETALLPHPLWCEREYRSECEGLGNCGGNGLMLCCFLLGLKHLWLCTPFLFLPFTGNFYPNVFLYVC